MAFEKMRSDLWEEKKLITRRNCMEIYISKIHKKNGKE
jgi:hypothetical protein